MLSRKSLPVVIAIALAVVASAAAGEKPWFDMKNCAMCKSMSPGLMESIDWENHNISNGIVCVTTVKPDQLAAYRTAHAEMMKSAQKLQQGEPLELCGSCTAFGACMAKGVHQEYVETKRGDVWIVTSDDPEVVAELQGWVKRNQEEMAKLSKEG